MSRALTPLCLAILLATTLLAGCVVEDGPAYYRHGRYVAPHFDHDFDNDGGWWHRGWR